MCGKILLRLWHSQPLHLVDSAQLTEGKGWPDVPAYMARPPIFNNLPV
jgi:hypothetical protein